MFAILVSQMVLARQMVDNSVYAVIVSLTEADIAKQSLVVALIMNQIVPYKGPLAVNECWNKNSKIWFLPRFLLPMVALWAHT